MIGDSGAGYIGPGRNADRQGASGRFLRPLCVELKVGNGCAPC
jgi:hypothetical protein